MVKEKGLYILLTLLALAFFTRCSPLEVEIESIESFDYAESKGVENVLKRAAQLAKIQWTPISDIPNNVDVFQAGKTVVGIPYSSTKQINKYIGLDVSFHTFMTAVHNPYSVLYSENLSKAPYYGKNCSTYYGGVCSTCVEYALGITIPYTADQLVKLPDFELLEDQSISNLKPGDILHNPGHVLMVYKMEYNKEGNISAIYLFESSGKLCKIYRQTQKGLENRRGKDGLKFYRYKKINEVSEYVPSEYVSVGNELLATPEYNNALCPDRGDKSVYRTNEEVVINVFDLTFDSLIIEDSEGKQIKYDTNSIVNLGTLAAGEYKAFLTNRRVTSNPVSFVVAKPIVTVKNQGAHIIFFSCDMGKAKYCVLCGKDGSPYLFHPFTEADIVSGRVELEPLTNYNQYFCKVVFETPYGTVINQPLAVK